MKETYKNVILSKFIDFSPCKLALCQFINTKLNRCLSEKASNLLHNLLEGHTETLIPEGPQLCSSRLAHQSLRAQPNRK